MKSLTFEKTFLIQRLNENRKLHEAIYKEAVVGYQKKAIELLTEKLAKLQDNPLESTHISLSIPAHHLNDYDRVILMFEHCIEATIELDEQEYSQYIQDNWTWTRPFLTSNSQYSGMAASGCLSL